jgi:uncharacterized protein (TIGR02246 family)
MKTLATMAVLVLVASLACVACEHTIRDVSPAVRDELNRAVQSYFEAANRSDTIAIMDAVLHDPRVTSVANGAITTGWEAIRDQVNRINAVPADIHVTLSGRSQQFLLSPSVALVVAPYTFTARTPERSVTLHAATTLVFEKSGGKWRIVHEHNSAMPPDAQGDARHN